MSKQETEFHCLRCGHTYEGTYDPKEPEEHTCSECRSNSVRPIRKRPVANKAPAAAG